MTANDPDEAATPFGEQATGAYTAQPVPEQPVQVGTPGVEGFPAAQPLSGSALRAHRRRVGWIVTIAIVAVVVLIAAFVLPLAFAGGAG